MNMGQRIEECLKELEWKQVDLLSKIPELEPATLSALIKRNSVRSQYMPQIADALGVHLRWLISGNGPKWTSKNGYPLFKDNRIGIAEPEPLINVQLTQKEAEYIKVFRALDEEGKQDIEKALKEKRELKDLRARIQYIIEMGINDKITNT